MSTDEFQNLNSDILRKCSELSLSMNILPTTLSLLSKLLTYDKTDIRSLLLLSNTHLKNKNYIKIIHVLIDAINSKTEFIINDYRIWKQLAFAYYKLNKYDDAHHAISQALSSVSTYKDTANINIKNIKVNNAIKPYTMFLTQQEQNIWKYKISVLNCRITLLAPEKTHSISLLLADFQIALSQVEFNKNIPLYLEILITRAQLFRKYRMMDECKQDLIQCLTILNEQKSAFKRDDLSNKVAYCYHFLISLEFLINSDFTLSLKLIKEVFTNFQLPSRFVQKFLILETYLRTISNPKESRLFVDTLKMEIPLVTNEMKPKLFYALGRLVKQEKTDENIELAYHFYQDALSITPENPIIWISFAALYFELGQFDDALSTYSQAASLASSSEILQRYNPFEVKLYHKLTALAWFGISQVYLATNQLSNSVDSINEAIGIFKIENDKAHADELETIKTKLQNSQTKNRRYNESRTVQQLINNEEAHIDTVTDNDNDNNNNSDEEDRDESVKLDSKSKFRFIVPDIPFEMLIEFETFQDQKVFTTEYELDPVSLADPIPDEISPKVETRQPFSNSILTPNSVTNLVSLNRNSTSAMNSVHASPNHITKPMNHQRSHSNNIEKNPSTASERYSNASKYVIIPNQKFPKKVSST